MSTVAEYREALSSREDDARNGLRRVVAEDLQRPDADRETVLAVLDWIRKQMREQGREADENAVMDVMDYVLGYCNPRMSI